MSAPDARDVVAELDDRRNAQFIVDAWGQRRASYATFHDRLQTTFDVYEGNWSVIWPDGESTVALPKVANLVQIAADDRARAVASLVPSVVCRAQRPGAKPRAAADKIERVVTEWLRRSRVWGHMVQRWALDAMAGGLMVCRVSLDTSLPRSERYPQFSQVSPTRCFPDPIFTPGPELDSMIVSYIEPTREVERKFGVKLRLGSDAAANPTSVRVIEFHDDTWSVIVVQAVPREGMRTKDQAEVVAEARHDLGVCPFAIGTRPTMSGEYRGEFYGSFGVLNFANRLRTLMLDDAINRVYPERITYNVENTEQAGPGAEIQLQTPDARYEYVAPGNQPFSNLQIMRDLLAEARSGVILPPARSGDPNESIISAAGIGAANSQFVEDVSAIRRDMLAPMLEHAVAIAAKWDRRWGDASKVIAPASASAYVENYTPTRDLPEELRIELRYGAGSGLDEINTNVMVLQQWAGGNGLISRRTAQELSPLVEDPQREEKQQLLEQLTEALKAGLIQSAVSGQLSAQQIAEVIRRVQNDEATLVDAIQAVSDVAPMAQPSSAAPAPAVGPPGIAGAAGPLLPPIEQLFGQE